MAEEYGADFTFLSPLFPTASHPGAAALGISEFKKLIEKTNLPVIALGGINADNCRQLSGHGRAVIGAILAAEQPDIAAKVLSEV